MRISLLTLPVIICIVLLIPGFTGCKSTVAGDLIVEAAPRPVQLETKADVYQVFGVPSTIRTAGENIDMYYVYNQTAGGSLGIGNMLIGLTAQRAHTAANTVVFRVNPEGRVVSVNQLRGTGVLRNTFWPFGD